MLCRATALYYVHANTFSFTIYCAIIISQCDPICCDVAVQFVPLPILGYHFSTFYALIQFALALCFVLVFLDTK